MHLFDKKIAMKIIDFDVNGDGSVKENVIMIKITGLVSAFSELMVLVLVVIMMKLI